jgi:hypothetical protein
VNPGDYALRSDPSRAAARAMLDGRQSAFERREVIICRPAWKCPAPRATEWVEDAKERTMGRVVSIPDGMTAHPRRGYS